MWHYAPMGLKQEPSVNLIHLHHPLESVNRALPAIVELKSLQANETAEFRITFKVRRRNNVKDGF
jgi:hypothetical protein